MASPTESRLLSPQATDTTWIQDPETTNPHSVTNPGQLLAHYHSVQNTTSKPTQPPTTYFQAFQPEITNSFDLHQSKPLNPQATIFVPAQLEHLYDQHRKAYLRQKLIKLDMDGIQRMLEIGELGEYNFERLGELSRELAHEFVDVGKERAKWIVAIEKEYGYAALGGRNTNLSADCI